MCEKQGGDDGNLEVLPPNIGLNCPSPRATSVHALCYRVASWCAGLGGSYLVADSISVLSASFPQVGCPLLFAGTVFLTVGMRMCCRIIDESIVEIRWIRKIEWVIKTRSSSTP
jgi:hypothetical protein